LLKQLNIRGLNQAALDIVFQFLVLNKIPMQSSLILVTSWNNRLTDYRPCSTKLRTEVLFSPIQSPQNFVKSRLPAVQANSYESQTLILVHEAMATLMSGPVTKTVHINSHF